MGAKPVGWVLDQPSGSHFLGGIVEMDDICFGGNKSQLLDGIQSDLRNTLLLSGTVDLTLSNILNYQGCQDESQMIQAMR